jgi:hypothetical protein
MTHYDCPSLGFTSVAWVPPEGWLNFEIKNRPGIHRLHTVFALTPRDRAYYRVKLVGDRHLDLQIQALMKRDGGTIYHACGMIKTRPGHGFHPFWAIFFFDSRAGGTLAVQPASNGFFWAY